MIKFVEINGAGYYKAPDGKLFAKECLHEALLYNLSYQFREYIFSSGYYVDDGDWIYIEDEYLFSVWKNYLSILNVETHPWLIENYDIFTNGLSVRDNALDDQDSIPHIYKDFKFNGKGWYRENSVFDPECDIPGIEFKEADECPLDPEYYYYIKEEEDHKIEVAL